MQDREVFSAKEGFVFYSRPVTRRGSQGRGHFTCSFFFTGEASKRHLEQKAGCGPLNTAPAHFREDQRSACCTMGRVLEGPPSYPESRVGILGSSELLPRLGL